MKDVPATVKGSSTSQAKIFALLLDPLAAVNWPV